VCRSFSFRSPNFIRTFFLNKVRPKSDTYIHIYIYIYIKVYYQYHRSLYTTSSSWGRVGCLASRELCWCKAIISLSLSRKEVRLFGCS
jgi:hypothetical protein